MSGWRVRVIAAVAAVAVTCGGIATGCGSPGVVLPATVNQHDPVQVIQAAVQTIFSWQPGQDSSAIDAFVRARPYLSAPLAAQHLDLSPPDAGTQWNQWATDRASITAKADVVPDEHPTDSPDTVFRVVAVTQSITTTDTAPQDALVFSVFVTAVNTPDGWRVDSVQA
jgi:hypothetical protein